VWKTQSNTLDDTYKELEILQVKQLVQYFLPKKYRNCSDFRIEQKHQYSTRKQEESPFYIPDSTNKYGKRTLKVVIPTLLNKLPKNVREIQSNYIFKKKIKKWFAGTLVD